MPPPYRVDHIGSLIRAGPLKEAQDHILEDIDRYHGGSQEQMNEIEALRASALEDIVRQQLDRGITTITTGPGEFERTAFWDGLFESLSGFEVTPVRFDSGLWRLDFPVNEWLKNMGRTGRMAKIATGKIKRLKSAHMEGWLRLRNQLPQDQWRHAKVTVLTPTWWHEMLEKPYIEMSGYTSDEEYLADIADALHEEIMELYHEGVRNVQVDDPLMAMIYTERDLAWAPVLHQHGTDVERIVSLHIATHNRMLRDSPADLNIGYHMCRGNIPGIATLQGGYNVLAETMFQESDYQLFLLEWDLPEHGDFSPLQHLPRHKAVVLGIISTKYRTLEDKEMLKGRTHEAAEVIGNAQGRPLQECLAANLAISPQCGFATFEDKIGEGMTIERQWQKMALLQDIAEEIWLGWKKRAGDREHVVLP